MTNPVDGGQLDKDPDSENPHSENPHSENPHSENPHSERVSRDRDSLTIAQAQATVDQWIQTIGVRYFDEMTNLAQLVEEVGEVARILSRSCGEQSPKPGETTGDLGDELADVLFVTICLANQSGIDLTDALRRNLDKKTRRDAKRHRENAKLAE
jgi:NTP pyrophosphatase (non-canonical NTP hydrolase)